MLLDISTLYLVATLVAALLGGMLLYFGRQQRIDALTWWGQAYLLGATSVALWALASATLGETLALSLDALGFLACAMVWTAARVFHGRSVHWLGLALGPTVWLVAVVGLAPDMADTRMTLGAGIIAAYAALTAFELGAERRRLLRRKWLALLVPLLHGAVLMLPVVMSDLSGAAGGSLQGNIWVTIFAVELVLYAVGTVFVIFMLVSERTVRAHKTAASIDPLTGLFNRRGFSEATARMIAREAAAGREVSVMIFDIDYFKSINDRFGHPAGDELLKLFATLVTNTLRITDLVSRIGGEEFAALLPCPIDEAVVAAERARLAFQNCGIAVEEGPVPTTVSIGIAGGPAGTELDVLLAAADTALYRAKRCGRNRVETTLEQPLSLETQRRRIAVGQPPALPITALPSAA